MSSAEPVYPNDESRFPAYPESERLLPEHGTYGEARPNARLNSTAETIGNAVGSAMERVRQLPERLQEMKQRFTVIRGRMQEDARSKANEAMTGLKDKAQDTVYQARTRADRLAREQPFAVIGAMAGLGLVLGIVLRVWRDHAD